MEGLLYYSLIVKDESREKEKGIEATIFRKTKNSFIFILEHKWGGIAEFGIKAVCIESGKEKNVC